MTTKRRPVRGGPGGRVAERRGSFAVSSLSQTVHPVKPKGILNFLLSYAEIEDDESEHLQVSTPFASVLVEKVDYPFTLVCMDGTLIVTPPKGANLIVLGDPGKPIRFQRFKYGVILEGTATWVMGEVDGE